MAATTAPSLPPPAAGPTRPVPPGPAARRRPLWATLAASGPPPAWLDATALAAALGAAGGLEPGPALAAALLAAAGLRLAGAYRPAAADPGAADLAAALAAALGALGAAAALAALGAGPPPPSRLAAASLAAPAALLGPRLAWRALRLRARAGGWLRRHLVVVGAGEQGRLFVERLRAEGDGTLRLLGVFDDRRDRVPGWIAGYPVLGGIDDLVAFASANRVDEVVLALPWSARERAEACLARLRGAPANLRLCPDLAGPLPLPAAAAAGAAPGGPAGGPPLVTVRELPLAHGRAGPAKGALDRGVAAALLLLTLPLLGAVALGMALTRGGRVLERDPYLDFAGRPLGLRAFVAAARAVGAAGPPLGALERALVLSGIERLPRLLDALAGRVALVGPPPFPAGDGPAGEAARAGGGRLAARGLKPGLVDPAADAAVAAAARGGDGDGAPAHAGPDRRRRLALDEAYAEGWSWRLDLQVLARSFR